MERDRTPTAGRGRTRAGVAAAVGAAVLAHALPAVTVLPGVRLRFFPALSGHGDPGRVALTFDDGPDPESTPRFVEVLAAHRVRATFFLLGSRLARAPQLGGDLAAAGHEVAVHGWTRRNQLRLDGWTTYRELSRTRDLVVAATGRTPRFFRPPHGVLTTPALLVARQLGLTPVLWTCWGRDWARTPTPASVLRAVRGGLTGGATVLLHGSDATSAPGSWRATLGALPDLLAECAERGWRVGPLDEHRLATPATDPA